MLSKIIKGSYYIHNYYKKNINKNNCLIIFENQLCSSSRILKLIETSIAINREKIEFFIVAKQKEKKEISKFICETGLEGVKIIEENSFEFLRLLNEVKYIVTDGYLPSLYIKKEGQICVNTCEEVSCVEKNINNMVGKGVYGKAKRTLVSCDYLIFKDSEKEKEIFETYNISELYRGETLVGFDRAIQSFPESQKKEDKCKTQVLVYPGELKINGITTSFRATVNNIDLEKINIVATVDEKALKGNGEKIEFLPSNVNLYPYSFNSMYSLSELLAYVLFFKMNICNRFTTKRINKVFEREFRKNFGKLDIDTVIQYSGYGRKAINVFRAFQKNKVIYVHSDMEKELKWRNNQHRSTLKLAYEEYDKVVVVTEAMKKSVAKIGGREDNIFTVNNFMDSEYILRKSNEEICFSLKTKANKPFDEILSIVENTKMKKFINLGRFSKEKGHDRLISAFGEYWRKNKDVFLIVIGGGGEEWENTKKIASESEGGENIILINSMENPYPILKKCNLLIQSSHYEALGLVLFEAAILNVPCFTTAIEGPMEFMKEVGGYLVEDSEEGILQGMKDYDDGKIDVLQLNVEKYNKEKKEGFYRLLKEGEK